MIPDNPGTLWKAYISKPGGEVEDMEEDLGVKGAAVVGGVSAEEVWVEGAWVVVGFVTETVHTFRDYPMCDYKK